MSKCEDIREQAKLVTVAIFEGSYLSRSVQGRVEDIVSTAILAAKAEEREACAQVAIWGPPDDRMDWSPDSIMGALGKRIAAAIRKRGEG